VNGKLPGVDQIVGDPAERLRVANLPVWRRKRPVGAFGPPEHRAPDEVEEVRGPVLERRVEDCPGTNLVQPEPDEGRQVAQEAKSRGGVGETAFVAHRSHGKRVSHQDAWSRGP
jgi:hypothetical protein